MRFSTRSGDSSGSDAGWEHHVGSSLQLPGLAGCLSQQHHRLRHVGSVFLHSVHTQNSFRQHILPGQRYRHTLQYYLYSFSLKRFHFNYSVLGTRLIQILCIFRLFREQLWWRWRWWPFFYQESPDISQVTKLFLLSYSEYQQHFYCL